MKDIFFPDIIVYLTLSMELLLWREWGVAAYITFWTSDNILCLAFETWDIHIPS